MRGVLDHPPQLLPGVREALAFLAARAKLAIISDTAFSPGSILRELMVEQDIDRYFSGYVFSDETGIAKPHPEAFAAALNQLQGAPEEGVHIGDIERTDIRGARGAGMKAILYDGGSERSKYAEDETAADAVMHHWNEIEEVLGKLG
jgi:putative hydrolase of the HAD superfamily